MKSSLLALKSFYVFSVLWCQLYLLCSLLPEVYRYFLILEIYRYTDESIPIIFAVSFYIL